MKQKISAFAITTLIILCSFFSMYHAASAAPADKIVAVVNDEIIMQSQLNQKMQQAQQQPPGAAGSAPTRQQVLDRMIDTSLQLQIAKAMGVEANDEAIDQTIEGIAQRNNMTVAQLREALKKEGMDFTRYRKDIREQMILGQVHQRIVGGKIKVNDDEIDQKMRSDVAPKNYPPAEYHVADIVLTLPETATTEEIAAKGKEAAMTLAELRQGTPFEALSIVKSGGSDALQGGDLGWRQLSDLPSLFVPYIQKLRPGEMSSPIHTPNGFHILRLLDMRGGDPLRDQRSITETEARHILLRTSVLAKATDLKLRLINIRRDLEHGADFAKVAEQYSQDMQSASKGGDLGWIKSGTMEPAFEQAIDPLKPGQISQPFATSAGWHLVQVLNRRKVDNSKNYLREHARQQAYGQKADAALKIWLKQIRAEAYIKIN
jgi:peptidyl-prolyl cis-trans isomerase SurA